MPTPAASGTPAKSEPIEKLLQTASVEKGAAAAKKCAACHNAEKGGPNALGPNLWGLLGEPIGQGAHGFAFSDALKSKGGTWDWQNLSDWLHSPKVFAPGTKMTFAGLSKPEDRANVIAYLNQQSDAPRPMPAVPAEATAADNATAPAAAGNEAAPAAK